MTGSLERVRHGTVPVLRLAATLVAIGVLAAGCGDDDGPGDAGTGETTSPPTSNTPGSGTVIGGPYPVAELTVTVEHPDTGTTTYRVTCLGDTATVSGDDVGIDEKRACAVLADPAVVTRLSEGPPGDQVCTEIYGGPDVATISGTIDEQPVDTSVDRVNGCDISDWDDLLAGFLPPATGVTG